MSLQSEPVTVPGDWRSRATTLRRHGATDAEIAFLRERRVEINAMTSRQIIEFIEAKLGEHGVTKLIPSDEVIESHARHVIEDILLQKAIDEVSKKIVEEAKAIASPADLREQIKREFKERPEMSWDAAIVRIVRSSETPL
jgi:hypothetical protein